ncbi:Cytochrome P450 family protein [Ceratobasidium theobromae]|uniref:Cytochrome P450 family protein n=1 Tax=Ceratobasidium theobromae TaxID=1582974 RepID=A0A5N5QQV2_9AGAM|nr:Cytochrome P450 family protein [Ceratobasidium theobromae]
MFRKDMAAYNLIMFHGPNIVASEGATWKRHRRAARAAFSEKSYSLVWEEAGRTLEEWFDTIRSISEPEVEVDMVSSLSKVTLNVIASAGFGEHFPWDNPIQAGSNQLPFFTSVVQAVHLTIWRALIPKWAYYLPVPVFLKTKLSYEEMDRHVINLIQEGKTSLDIYQILGAMDAYGLFHEVFMLAGHDTTAHTTAFITGILALYPNIHARIREEADALWPGAHLNPVVRNSSAYKEDFHRLTYAQAVLNETLRHFPPEPVIPRIVGENSVLPGTKRDPADPGSHMFEQSFSVPLSKGDIVVADIYGLHMNTHYWGPNASEFDPDRFLSSDWPKHAFMPFLTGPRSCLGRGFAIAEAVRIVATIAQDWDLMCRDDLMRMPRKARWDLLLRWRQDVTMTPLDIKLVFKKRSG